MNRMEGIIDKMTGYVCDKICKHMANGNLDQDRLDEICAECRMGDHVDRILNEYKGAGLYRSGIEGRFVGTDKCVSISGVTP